MQEDREKLKKGRNTHQSTMCIFFLNFFVLQCKKRMILSRLKEWHLLRKSVFPRFYQPFDLSISKRIQTHSERL